ncbi:hypothetical protein ACHWQZ_G008860 [Mnemiopsis leidyi]
MTQTDNTVCYYVGVDVGTGSARASLCDVTGRELATSSRPLTVYNPLPDHYEQRCTEIWGAVCGVVRDVTQGVGVESVCGIGFDATCSLVLVDSSGEPLSVSLSEGENNTCLMWMDHRAERETELVNQCKSCVTDYVGGGFSPEQQPPKLLWLKKNLPDTWSRAAHLFDLPDWLTYRATGQTDRSLCSVTCKWGYVLERGGWDKEFLREVNLEDLAELEKLGTCICSPGESVSGGLSDQAATELGLRPGTSVAVSMIDAHAGTLALLRCAPSPVCETLCIISGTSTCIMALSHTKTWVPGVWGPYQGAVLPDIWLYEGGQTAAGSALDHIVRSHPAHTAELTYSKLNSYLGASLTDPALHTRTRDVHVVPDLHGNRSPLALPWFRGMVSGLDLNSSLDNLHTMYLATVQGLALGVRLVIEKLKKHGLKFSYITLCGGLADNPLYLHVLATVTKLPVVVPRGGNMMCIGAALLAQCAAENCSPTEKLESGKGGADNVSYCPIPELVKFYQQKFEVYRHMVDDQLQYRELMKLDRSS